jgi:hypothetical protein
MQEFSSVVNGAFNNEHSLKKDYPEPDGAAGLFARIFSFVWSAAHLFQGKSKWTESQN